jgi:hypothetical protein
VALAQRLRCTERSVVIADPLNQAADEIEILFNPAQAVDLYGDGVTEATEWPKRNLCVFNT